MDWVLTRWESLIGPAVVAAVVSAIVAFVAMLINRSTTIQVHREKLNADRELAERKFTFDKELAQRKFDLDRSQLIHKRRFELAENLLADAYRFRSLMAFVRNGATFGNEGETRKGEESEPDNIKRLRNTYFVPFERLQKEKEFISGFMAKEHAARAHFGADAAKAISLFWQSIVSVETASGMLIDMADERSSDPILAQQLRQDIWAGYSEARKQNDEVGKKIEEGVSLIENFCRPVLEWNGA